MDGVVIRAAEAGDVAFLTGMLVAAVNWLPGRTLPEEQVLAVPELVHYVAGWPREGDLGSVAVAGGEPVGAAWLRLMPAGDPGFGFVAADVPELSLGVVPAWRGRGVGRALLRAVAAQARAAGRPGISLSVERANEVARSLYLAEGYRVVGGDANTDTMLLAFAPA